MDQLEPQVPVNNMAEAENSMAARVAQSPAPANESVAVSSSPPQKYRVFRAILDTFEAIGKNPLSFVLSIVISYAVALGTLFALGFVAVIVLAGALNSVSSLLFAYVEAMLMFTIWFSFAYALILSLTSLTLSDGKQTEKTTVGAVLSVGLARVGRVIVANLLYALVTIWPAAALVVLSLAITLSGKAGTAGALFGLLSGIGVIIWIYIALVRYALTPYVALFEPETPIIKTLGRSKHLLQHGGQWFLIKGFLLTFLAIIVLAVATGNNLSQLQNSDNLGINGFFIVTSILINGVLVMLYQNRKAVRG